MYDIGSFYEAASVEDAIRKLQEWPDAEIISGGSDVLIKIREGKLAGRSLVSIHNIAVLKGVTMEEDGTIVIGPGTSFSHITAHPLVQQHIPMLGYAVDQVGGPADPQYRHHWRQCLQRCHQCGQCVISVCL